MPQLTPSSIPQEPRRLRMFAGPNGSGKTSLARSLSKEFSSDGLFQLHDFLNADDLLRELQSGGGVSLSMLGHMPSEEEVRTALVGGNRLTADHPFLSALYVQQDRLFAPLNTTDGYVGAALTDFLRESLFANGASFSFETVMSHPSKIDFFRRARDAGFRTYLYFVATDSPDLNILRIQNRVALGEHDVPPDKIIQRYERRLKLLADAIFCAYRTYIFDNSGNEPIWLAEWLPDGSVQLKTGQARLPDWFHTWVVPHFSELNI